MPPALLLVSLPGNELWLLFSTPHRPRELPPIRPEALSDQDLTREGLRFPSSTVSYSGQASSADGVRVTGLFPMALRHNCPHFYRVWVGGQKVPRRPPSLD